MRFCPFRQYDFEVKVALSIKDFKNYDAVLSAIIAKTPFDFNNPFNSKTDWENTGKVTFMGETIFSAERDLKLGFCDVIGQEILANTTTDRHSFASALIVSLKHRISDLARTHCLIEHVDQVLSQLSDADKDDLIRTLNCSNAELKNKLRFEAQRKISAEIPFSSNAFEERSSLYDWITDQLKEEISASNYLPRKDEVSLLVAMINYGIRSPANAFEENDIQRATDQLINEFVDIMAQGLTLRSPINNTSDWDDDGVLMFGVSVICRDSIDGIIDNKFSHIIMTQTTLVPESMQFALHNVTLEIFHQFLRYIPSPNRFEAILSKVPESQLKLIAGYLKCAEDKVVESIIDNAAFRLKYSVIDNIGDVTTKNLHRWLLKVLHDKIIPFKARCLPNADLHSLSLIQNEKYFIA